MTTTVATITIGMRFLRTPRAPCDAALVRTSDAPTRCRYIVERMIQSEIARIQNGSVPPRRSRTTHTSTLKSTTICACATLYRTSAARVSGAGNSSCTSASENTSAGRSLPSTHPLAIVRKMIAV